MTATNYIWDFPTDTCIMEKDDSATTSVLTTSEPVKYGKVLSQHRITGTQYCHFDGQSSTRQLTAENGNVTREYSYSAFGQVTATSGVVQNPFAFVGVLGYYADFSDMYYIRARCYDASIGRWISQDAVDMSVNEPTINLYSYGDNNPVNRIDPGGDTAIAVCLPAAAGCAVVDGPLPIGDVVAIVIIVVAAAIDVCRPKICPPCPLPPPPTIRFDRVPPSELHWPCPGNHTHVIWFETNQRPYPDCGCFHNRREYVDCH